MGFLNLLKKNTSANKKGYFKKKLKHFIIKFHTIEGHYRKIFILYQIPINEKTTQEFKETKEQGILEIENLWSDLSKGRKSIPRDFAKLLVAFAKDMENLLSKATFPPSSMNIDTLTEPKDSEKKLAKRFLEELENYKIHLPKNIMDLLRDLSK